MHMRCTGVLHKSLCTFHSAIRNGNKDLCNNTGRSRVQSQLMLQVCVARGVIVWELGRATSRDLGTENSQEGETELKGAARTLGLQFRCINLYAHTAPLSAQIEEWYVHKDLCTKGSLQNECDKTVIRSCICLME